MFTVTIQSEQEMHIFATKIASLLKPNMMILLHGDLGAGKTTFTKGIARGLGITKVIKSPTYTFVKEYEHQPLSLYHFDVYRLENIGGEGLGFEEYFERQGVCVIEWSQFIQELLPPQHLDITIARVDDNPNARQVSVHAVGEIYQSLLKDLNVSMNDAII